MQSVTKTITSVITGVAMHRDEFRAEMDAPILQFFDIPTIKNLDDRKRRVTLRDLLTMRSGLEMCIRDSPGLGPKRMIGKDGKVVALETLKTKWVFDQNKRFNPAFYEGSETELECDTIIMAVGQAPNLDFLKPEDGVE